MKSRLGKKIEAIIGGWRKPIPTNVLATATSPEDFGEKFEAMAHREDPEPALVPADEPKQEAKSPDNQVEARPSLVKAQFGLGVTVEWESQAAASWKKKRGKIIVVVRGGSNAKAALEAAGYNFPSADFGFPRKEESYIVLVPSPSGKGRGTVYWPLANKLKIVTN